MQVLHSLAAIYTFQQVLSCHFENNNSGDGTEREQPVAAARKLTCVVWAVLTTRQPNVEENKEFTKCKTVPIARGSRKAAAFSEHQLDDVTELLCTKAAVIDKSKEDIGIGSIEDEQEE